MRVKSNNKRNRPIAAAVAAVGFLLSSSPAIASDLPAQGCVAKGEGLTRTILGLPDVGLFHAESATGRLEAPLGATVTASGLVTFWATAMDGVRRKISSTQFLEEVGPAEPGRVVCWSVRRTEEGSAVCARGGYEASVSENVLKEIGDGMLDGATADTSEPAPPTLQPDHASGSTGVVTTKVVLRDRKWEAAICLESLNTADAVE